jgi:hypothetical protein
MLADDAKGAYASDKVYSDVCAEDIASLPESQPHHEGNLELEAADMEGLSMENPFYVAMRAEIYLKDT